LKGRGFSRAANAAEFIRASAPERKLFGPAICMQPSLISVIPRLAAFLLP
jgi:hypothetical protein